MARHRSDSSESSDGGVRSWKKERAPSESPPRKPDRGGRHPLRERTPRSPSRDRRRRSDSRERRRKSNSRERRGHSSEDRRRKRSTERDRSVSEDRQRKHRSEKARRRSYSRERSKIDSADRRTQRSGSRDRRRDRSVGKTEYPGRRHRSGKSPDRNERTKSSTNRGSPSRSHKKTDREPSRSEYHSESKEHPGGRRDVDRPKRGSSHEEDERAKELQKQDDEQVSSETAEERKARRLAKKKAKEERKKQEKGWDQEYAGYTNDDNPFGDSNLLQTFKWKKKLEKAGLKDIADSELEKINRRKREEQRQELEKVKQRRLERERERAEREQLMEMEQRKREGAQFEEWAKQEDTFHLQQAKLRSKIRIEEGRAMPVDLLASYISAEDEDFSLEMVEPYLYLDGLSLDDFEDLIEDINVLLQLESKKNQEFWNDIRIIIDEEIRKLRVDDDNGGRRAINSEVNADIMNVFKGKTPKQLEVMKSQIESKLKNKGPGLDVTYWTTLLSRLSSYMARARLRDRHVENLRRKLECLKQEQGVENQPEVKVEQTDEPSTSSPKQTDEGAPSTSREDESDEDQIDSANDPLQLCIDEYESGRYTPTLVELSKLEPGTLLIDPAEDENRRNLRMAKKPQGSQMSSVEEAFEREARKGMDDSEAKFSVEQVVDVQTYQWSDKYRPRKPRYFNRVHTGFEWNKYNQTHYDIDNPPPKIVQGYKFNIFYPDLIDKNKTPQYFLTEACKDNPDFAILRFHSGPPYEDIAFKIVNREWEYSYKKGFRCQFHNDIFQLWFHFKRYRYRR